MATTSTGAISSARTATTSVFDMVTQSAGLITNTLTSASQGMDILHSYVRIAHGAATQNLETKIQAAKELDLMHMAKNHSKSMLNIQKELNEDPQLADLFAKNLARFSGQPIPEAS